ncbi:MAG: helix-turn-helix domain-containing protein [Actinobacteria bacterium]|nr:helix-turn-helix domain-containing protein [Actinomycetota bacterium]MCL6105020.1 helix-turn-helix domain-containing protein [Actinomycetota bacterium]
MISDKGQADLAPRIRWISTKEASEQLGITLRTLYRFIDEGALTAYKFGRVIRLKEDEIEKFIESVKVVPGTLEHLYPDTRRVSSGSVSLKTNDEKADS